MSELKLEVGKRYETRDGRVALVESFATVEPGSAWSDFVYRVVDERNKLIGYHRQDGKWNIGDDRNPRDLIREITDEQAPPEEFTPPEFVEAPSPLQLEVGKFYRARNGEIAEVFAEGGSYYNDFAGKVGHLICTWDASGAFDRQQGETVFDLIEEVPAPVAEAVAEMEFEAGPATHVFPDLGVKLEGDAQAEDLGGIIQQQYRDGTISRYLGFGETTEKSDIYHAEYLRDKEDQRLVSRADRFATYCRAILFVMLGVAAMTFATRATAKELLVTPNNAGGEIVLTDVESKECGKVMRVALARSGTGEMVRGCWLYTESNYVYVKWGEDVRMYRLDQFEIPGRVNDEPVRPDHLTPWRGA